MALERRRQSVLGGLADPPVESEELGEERHGVHTKQFRAKGRSPPIAGLQDGDPIAAVNPLALKRRKLTFRFTSSAMAEWSGASRLIGNPPAGTRGRSIRLRSHCGFRDRLSEKTRLESIRGFE
jgi:hypothetical protein